MINVPVSVLVVVVLCLCVLLYYDLSRGVGRRNPFAIVLGVLALTILSLALVLRWWSGGA